MRGISLQFGRLTLEAEVLGPMEALVSATRANAQIMRIEDRLGTLEPGKLADLVAFDGDPCTCRRVRAERDLDRDRERLRQQPHRRKSAARGRTGGCNSPKSSSAHAGGAASPGLTEEASTIREAVLPP